MRELPSNDSPATPVSARTGRPAFPAVLSEATVGSAGPGADTVRLTVLGSGSGGNATLVVAGGVPVLVDAGLSCRELVRRLGSLGVEAGALAAVLLTHAHGDHVRAVSALTRRHEVPVFSTAATREAFRASGGAVSGWREIAPGRPFDLAGLRVLPFRVPHDTLETLAFRIETMAGVLGLATDVGEITPELVSHFRDCRVLVIESNHARDLLRVSPYAASVRRRIGSDLGHLANEALAEFVERDLGASVRYLVLAHLSRVNNLPELAEIACREALARAGRRDVTIVLTHQDRCSRTVTLRPTTAQSARGRRVSAWQPRLPLGQS